ncbi:DUF4345 domain-containing protein [Micromonospora yasonensis]|uniref:DUF4345 domain-containing protein n=1 Tax=Micromonospora yasonensis TaxID=1128667 RepID=UPI002232C0E7|nr:DUF4345 domain-containing protein [Micromonospora yasonensis]MCW3839860.1 DUF4345 domain-containing protein [Micromonospora yasonensis]
MVVLAVLATVPVVSGLAGLLIGPAFIPGGASTPVSVDNNYRFIDAYWLAAGVGLWWSLFRLEERAIVTRAILVIAVVGGFGRLMSVLAVGWPNPVFGTALVLELVALPLVVWWHARVVRAGERQHEPAKEAQLVE